MPIYEYECAACGRIVEKWQKFSEAPLTLCPGCGGSLNKLISSCAFHLKGGGWYVKEYGGSGGGVKAESKSPAADSKPADAAAPGGDAAAPAKTSKFS